MLKFIENDIVDYNGDRGVVQYMGKEYIAVFFTKSGKTEIFNKDGSKKDTQCQKVEEFTARKNLMNFKELGKLLKNLKGRFLH